MLISENGTGYSDSHFHLEGNNIINNFTEKIVGILTDKQESNNFYCIYQPKKKSIWKKLIEWVEIHELRHQRQTQQQEMMFLEEAKKLDIGYNEAQDELEKLYDD